MSHQGDDVVTVTPCEDGPLLIRGPFELVTQDGVPIPAGRATVALCRCGFSSVKPFCDGSHKVARLPGAQRARGPGLTQPPYGMGRPAEPAPGVRHAAAHGGPDREPGARRPLHDPDRGEQRRRAREDAPPARPAPPRLRHPPTASTAPATGRTYRWRSRQKASPGSTDRNSAMRPGCARSSYACRTRWLQKRAASGGRRRT
ncbi:CDGSH iron-sulfur domain-containing protein [Nonomuraea ferruginea]